MPVNGFFETRDGQWLCFNGAYPHLRDGILKYFDAPHDQNALIKRVAQHDSAKIEADFEALGLCTAPVCTPEEWLAHPQGQALAAEPVVLAKVRAPRLFKVKLTCQKPGRSGFAAETASVSWSPVRMGFGGDADVTIVGVVGNVQQTAGWGETSQPVWETPTLYLASAQASGPRG